MNLRLMGGFLICPPQLCVLEVFLLKGTTGGNVEGVCKASLVLVFLGMQGLGNKEELRLWRSFFSVSFIAKKQD